MLNLLRTIIAGAVFSLSVAGAGFVAPSLAIEPGAPESVISTLDAARIHIRAKLDAKGRGALPLTKAEKDGLAAFYGETGPMLWVDENGLTSRLRGARAAFSRAAEWGLDPQAYALPTGETFDPAQPYAAEWLGDTELNATLALYGYAKHAQSGRADLTSLGEYVDFSPAAPDMVKFLAGLLRPNANIAAFLESYHPSHPQFAALKAKLAQMQGARGREEPQAARIPNGPVLKPGTRHPQIALIRERLNAEQGIDGDDFFDEAVLEAVIAFQKEKNIAATGVIGPQTRMAMNGGAGGASADAKTLILNMERWRWLPRELGATHVMISIPDFMFQVVKSGSIIHEERIVVGKISNPTPAFTKEMEFVVLNPAWNVPESIKINEILPMLRRNPAYLERQGLQVFYAGRRGPLDPYATDWDYVDPRKLSIRQPPGDDNVLGQVKFLFPNKHAVYMHDTTSRQLFTQTVRAYSHGCIRVRDPLRFAELLLAGQGWGRARIDRALTNPAEQSVTLEQKVPVHVTYMTASVANDGRVKTAADIYGHDAVLAGALGLGPRVQPRSPRPVSEAPVRRKQPSFFSFFD